MAAESLLEVLRRSSPAERNHAFTELLRERIGLGVSSQVCDAENNVHGYYFALNTKGPKPAPPTPEERTELDRRSRDTENTLDLDKVIARGFRGQRMSDA